MKLLNAEVREALLKEIDVALGDFAQTQQLLRGYLAAQGIPVDGGDFVQELETALQQLAEKGEPKPVEPKPDTEPHQVRLPNPVIIAGEVVDIWGYDADTSNLSVSQRREHMPRHAQAIAELGGNLYTAFSWAGEEDTLEAIQQTGLWYIPRLLSAINQRRKIELGHPGNPELIPYWVQHPAVLHIAVDDITHDDYAYSEDHIRRLAEQVASLSQGHKGLIATGAAYKNAGYRQWLPHLEWLLVQAYRQGSYPSYVTQMLEDVRPLQLQLPFLANVECYRDRQGRLTTSDELICMVAQAWLQQVAGLIFYAIEDGFTDLLGEDSPLWETHQRLRAFYESYFREYRLYGHFVRPHNLKRHRQLDGGLDHVQFGQWELDGKACLLVTNGDPELQRQIHLPLGDYERAVSVWGNQAQLRQEGDVLVGDLNPLGTECFELS